MQELYLRVVQKLVYLNVGCEVCEVVVKLVYLKLVVKLVYLKLVVKLWYLKLVQYLEKNHCSNLLILFG